jgi:excisionase family DNA binding protein
VENRGKTLDSTENVCRVQGVPPGVLTPTEAAAHLGIHVDTLKAAADRGEIPCWRTPGGHRRFNLIDLDRYRDKRSEPNEAAS